MIRFNSNMRLGIVGVNMLYSCMFLTDPEEILMSLLDGLTRAG